MARATVAARPADTPPPLPPLPKRRGVELALLVGAVFISVCGYVVVGLARWHALPGGAIRYGAGLGGLALLAHLAVRFRAPYADPLLLPTAVLLNGLGLVLIFRLDQDTPADHAAPTQLMWSTVGVALFTAVVVLLRDHRMLQRYAYVCAALALVLMAAPILFPAVNGAKIWIRFAGFSLQPGEFAKVLITIFFAGYLAANRAALAHTGRRMWRLRLPTGRVLGPIVAVWLISVAVLVLERDLGTSLLFFGIFVVLLYVATGRTGWLAIGLVLAGVGAVAVGTLEPHVHSRVEDWQHPFAGIAAGKGPGQLAQSLFAFAAGGMFGTGLGQGHSYLIGFAMKSDFILATYGEELGLAGLTALFLLYALLVACGYRAAVALRDPFGSLLAVGLAALPALQVFVIAGGVMGLIPLTGMAMPFLAQGGSSVVTNWIIVALLLRISNRARMPRPEGGNTAGSGAAGSGKAGSAGPGRPAHGTGGSPAHAAGGGAAGDGRSSAADLPAHGTGLGAGSWVVGFMKPAPPQAPDTQGRSRAQNAPAPAQTQPPGAPPPAPADDAPAPEVGR
ncbi:FtsW/RodA/SpoVE family cell cycle protein [Streptomyces decoyicus]|uniref:FtsW/RodA/SpoVE family cell cycle protein n=1 Tax=Streptomyces decoyicus TaxID=249567 RepID=A0ABZ1FUW1_9ACTN|nr:FtsW/RodA/SpoVE family cell cycle protein [Streptomyces decoyicus]WSB73946.1 FtsW/RodA/SpoVE family cell cycle protein [Streptomyces decoyicus]